MKTVPYQQFPSSNYLRVSENPTGLRWSLLSYSIIQRAPSLGGVGWHHAHDHDNMEIYNDAHEATHLVEDGSFDGHEHERS